MLNVFKQWLVIAPVFLFASFSAPVERLSLQMVSRTLKDGKSLTAKAEIYFQSSDGLLVTRFTYPLEYLIFTNAKGDYKMYQPKDNSVVLEQGENYSSENSFIYYFLVNNTSDMGLKAAGFKLNSTRMEESLVITTWIPSSASGVPFTSAELVMKEYKPVYLSFIGKENKPVQKIYYTNYQQAGEVSLPFNITEIQYLGEKDSLITRRTYSDAKINGEVSMKYFHFKIPADAKVVK